MKTGFWLKGGNGKLAGATVYKDKSTGETIMREVVTPMNPKTDQQLMQRVIMNTIAQAYGKLKDICDHSFEGIKKGRETMAYFISQNVQFCRDRVSHILAQGLDLYECYSFVPLGAKGYVNNQYQIAMGSLPRITVEYYLDEPNAVDYYRINKPFENTYRSIIEQLGLQRGDQLTFCMMCNPYPYGTRPDNYWGISEFHYARIILDPTNEDGTQASLDTPFLVLNAETNLYDVNKPSVRNEGQIVLKLGEDGLRFEYRTDYSMHAAGVIVSRQASDDKWLRSTTYMAYNDSEEYSLGECIDRAKSGKVFNIYTPNSQYLNNAGEGGQSAASEEQEDSPVTVEGCTIDGVAMTAGTASTTTNDSPSVVLSLQNGAGAVGKIKDSGGQVVAHADASQSGVITMAASDLDEGTYTIAYNLGGSDITTGFSFTVQSAPPSGGGGFGG